ncbi:MAG: hypothetical protein ACLP4V_25425 [Methylocella sp.]
MIEYRESSDSPDHGVLEPLLDSNGASEFLRRLDIPRSPATLIRQRSAGGDTPPHRKVGRAVRYDPADLREWVAKIVSGPRRTTSEPLLSRKRRDNVRSEPSNAEAT